MCTTGAVDTQYPGPHSAHLPAMSAHGTRTLSRVFQATMRMITEKRTSCIVEDTIPTLSGKDLAFELDFSSNECERIWDYHTKLVFKDGKFIVRTLSSPLLS